MTVQTEAAERTIFDNLGLWMISGRHDHIYRAREHRCLACVNLVSMSIIIPIIMDYVTRKLWAAILDLVVWLIRLLGFDSRWSLLVLCLSDCDACKPHRRKLPRPANYRPQYWQAESQKMQPIKFRLKWTSLCIVLWDAQIRKRHIILLWIHINNNDELGIFVTRMIR